MMASQGQWYLNSTDLLVNTTMKYSSIQTVPSGDNYTVYYNIEFTTTNAMANISCNDTDHGSMYRDNYYQITHAKQNMPNNPSDERYTTAIYDLQWSATSDTYEVSVLKLVDVRYHDSGPSILGYCSSLMYNAKIKLLVAELPSVDMKSTGRWDSIVDLGYGMSINVKGLFNKAITLCSIDAYNKPEARKCNWPNFKRVIGNYHQLVTQMFRDRSESPVYWRP
ncbi:hypothetical protein FBU59_002613 [Linderina macrospora]|uniref:Uncharacterized protein n=1 Tax=Linderina macrospora TaxID=4868 RepID=A0ACC1JAT3_9FUNG|nr:hypothetical protein FBU59_002613 [Linderina macrospora]